jgi:molybdopterin biosynthesis enzyme MoaB
MAIHSPAEQVEVVDTTFNDTMITMGGPAVGDNDDLTSAAHHEHLMAAIPGFVG